MSQKKKKITLKERQAFPSAILVFGQVVNIEFSRIHGNYGLCDAEERMLTLDTTQTKEQAYDTLVHEIIHAVLGISGMAELFTDEQNEALTVALTTGLAKAVDVDKLRLDKLQEI